jgi:hypothetical protein
MKEKKITAEDALDRVATSSTFSQFRVHSLPNLRVRRPCVHRNLCCTRQREKPCVNAAQEVQPHLSFLIKGAYYV